MASRYKTGISIVAAFAAAGVLASISTSAQAADLGLGGDCCADLEERIAELEATTARKGNRKVSLTIYGKVNEAIGWWDDGFEKNVYQFTNDTSRTRFGFKGKAKISDDLYAKYKIEVGVRSEDQGALDADFDDGGSGFDLRKSEWTIGSRTLGEVTVGEASMSHDGITQIQVANIKHFANPDTVDAVDSFGVRESGTGFVVNEWDPLYQNYEPGEGSRGNLVRYNSPTFAGFEFSAHWGEDDIWGTALRYAGEFGAFKLAAGIGYGEATERDEECTEFANGFADCQELGMSASIMHTPSGVFVTGVYGIRWDDGRAEALQNNGFAPDDEITVWHVQAGIEQKWFSLGETTVFGGYQEHDTGMPVNDSGGGLLTNGGAAGGVITNAEINVWEIGINQHIDAAAMDFYLHYKNYDADVTATTGSVDTEDWQTVIFGSHIKF